MAFMSYVHWDDQDRQVTKFRERLSHAVQVHIGLEFPIFQDRDDIKWGQNWRERIDTSVDQVTFLIPIITPGFFNSKECRKELERFIQREKKLGRNDLILPIYFVDTPLLNEPESRTSDELAEVIASRQYADWRELRFRPFTNPQVRKALAQLGMQIRDALSRGQTVRKEEDNKVLKIASTTSNLREYAQPTRRPAAKTEPPSCIVDPMHRGDFAGINEAIKAVGPGTRILVRPGLYQEGLIINKPLEIIGDGKPGEVVIQMAGMSVIGFQTTMGRIVNLTLRQTGGGNWFCVKIVQGRLELEECDITSQSLSCVAIGGGADPQLRRNRIHDSKKGSGVFIYDKAQGTFENNDIFGNAHSGIGIKDEADPVLRRNQIHDCQQSGVHVYGRGRGTFEDNDIFGNAHSGVQIKTRGNPTLRRNRIHDNIRSGVYVHDGGQGVLEDNHVFLNDKSGIRSRSSGNPIVRNNRIYKNAGFGIWIYENGIGTFESNDLTRNEKGAWSISEDSKANVKRSFNKE